MSHLKIPSHLESNIYTFENYDAVLTMVDIVDNCNKFLHINFNRNNCNNFSCFNNPKRELFKKLKK